jgi:hypothetical protein
MGLFGAGVAAADSYAGQKYSDAASAASSAGLTSIVAARVGDKLTTDDCVVTRSQVAPFNSANDGIHVSGKVQFYLNCAGAYATATTPGASLGSPEGRDAKAAADQAAAEEQASLEGVSTPNQ